MSSAAPVSALTCTRPNLIFDCTTAAGFPNKVATQSIAREAWLGGPTTLTGLKYRADAYSGAIDDGLLAAPTSSKASDTNSLQSQAATQNEIPTQLTDLAFAHLVDPTNTFYSGKLHDMLVGLQATHWSGVAWSNNALGWGDLWAGVGLAYDWGWDVFKTDAERASFVGSVRKALNNSIGSTNSTDPFHCIAYQNSSPPFAVNNSNWMGVCAGGAGLALLAMNGEPWSDPSDPLGSGTFTPPAAVMGQAHDYVQMYLGTVPSTITALPSKPAMVSGALIGSEGDGSEGELYAFYGLKNALLYLLAYNRQNPGSPMTTPGLNHIAEWLVREHVGGMGPAWLPRNDSYEALGGGEQVIPELYALSTDSNYQQLVRYLFDQTYGADGDQSYGDPSQPTEPVQDVASPILPGGAFTIAFMNDTPGPASAGQLPSLSSFYSHHGLVDFRTGYGTGAACPAGAVEPLCSLSVETPLPTTVPCPAAAASPICDVEGSFEARWHAPGEYYEGHNQFDLGQFTLYGYGDSWAVGNTYAHIYNNMVCTTTTPITGCSPSTGSGDPSSQPAGSNLVEPGCSNLPDGVRPDGVSPVAGPQVGNDGFAATDTIGRAYLDGPNMTFAQADLHALYQTSVTSNRSLLFDRVPGEPVFLAVADGFSAPTAIPYCWQMQTDSYNAVSVTGPDQALIAARNGALGTLTTATGSLPPAVLTAVEPNDPAVTGAGTGDTSPRTVLVDVEPDPIGSFSHLAVLAVAPDGAGAAQGVEDPTATGGEVIEENWALGEAIFAAAALGSSSVSATVVTTAGPLALTTDGRLAQVQPGLGETLLDGGTKLCLGTTPYATASTPAYISVSGGVAQATTTAAGGTGTFTVYAPGGLTSAVVNDLPVTPSYDPATGLATFGNATPASPVPTC